MMLRGAWSLPTPVRIRTLVSTIEPRPSIGEGKMKAAMVMCTVPVKEAKALADELLKRRLVACANMLGPVHSRFLWKGSIEGAKEVLMILKTTMNRIGTLQEAIAELHSYDVPEVLVFEAAGGLPAYLGWLAESCRPLPEER